MPLIDTKVGPIAYVQRGGEGVPAVFIHGAGGSHRHWGPLFTLLPMSRRFALDLPGHGRSPGPARRTITEYGAVVEAFMESVGLKQAVIVGHSMGGAISLWLALERPERVAALGLLATAARLRVPQGLLEELRSTPEAAVGRLVPLLYSPGAAPATLLAAERELHRVDARVLQADYTAAETFDISGAAREIAVHAAIICGRADRLVLPEESRLLERHLQHPTFHVIDGAGHMLVLEAPAAAARALEPLLIPPADSAYARETDRHEGPISET